MISLDELLGELAGAGVTIRLEESGNLKVRPASALNDDQREAIRFHKPQIVSEWRMELGEYVQMIFGPCLVWGD